jgi:uncharacterized protein (DUF305 family)
MFPKLALTTIASISFIASGTIVADRLNCPTLSPPTAAVPTDVSSAPHRGMMQSMQVNSEFEYLSQMIPHHQEAIDTAQMVLERSDRPEMRQFAQQIINTQTAEIAQMQTWLREWYPDQQNSVTYSSMMRSLDRLQGDALDQAFLEDMTMHHMGAVMMSHRLLRHNLVGHTLVQPFAQQIASSQQAEIRQMQVWLQDWFGATGRMGGMHHGRYGRG